MGSASPSYPVAIIGGGASGAMVAYHLLRLRPDLAPGQVAIIEPRAQLGAGLAYGTQDPQHRINVPASRMSLDTSVPGDFRAWLDLDALSATDPDAFLPSGDLYPSRAQFGRYVAARLAPEITSGRLQHIRAEALDITRDRLWRIALSDGPPILAERLVIALTHPAPALPVPLRALAHDRRVIANPWRDDALSRIGVQDRVAIIGTGLTMADVVASLTVRGHHGPIVAFSRRGLRPRAHAAEASALSELLPIAPAPTARGLLRHVRQALRDHADLSWHEVIDAVRKQGLVLWSALSLPERRRLIRHLRPFWDVHRFRIAPQIDAILTQRLTEKTLSLRAARLVSAEISEGGVRLRIQPRDGTKLGEPSFPLVVDHVINTTGPDHAGIVAHMPVLRSLAAQGALVPDPTGLGLHTSLDHHALSDGHKVDSVLIAGPLSRGTFGELMGLPEVTENAQSVARHLAALLSLATQRLPDEVRS